jgi:GDP-4-dehydro-6-deoxy-D-mannose reductase
MRILITGATGFAGGHLVEALLSRSGVQLHGLCRRAAWPPEWAHLSGRVSLNHADLTTATDLPEILDRINPDWIFHLAGYADATKSRAEPEEAWAGNLTATKRFYDAIAEWGGKPRILYVSSGRIYGDVRAPGGMCDESQPIQPVGPYAESKAAADLLSIQRTHDPGMDIVIVRPFNHTGPRQTPGYPIPRFASQLVAISRGQKTPPIVETYDLSAYRDFTDVRDMVRAYILLLEKGGKGEAYNAGSGNAVSLNDVLARLIAIAKVQAQICEQKDAHRPAASPITRADATKLRSTTGWKPEISLDQMLVDTFKYWETVPQTADYGPRANT